MHGWNWACHEYITKRNEVGQMVWFVFIIILIFAGIVFSKRNKAKRAMRELDSLTIASDHGDEDAQHRLWEERERRNISDEAFIRYRRSLYTRLAQNGDAFAEYQLGEDAKHFLKQPRVACEHLQRAANMGSTDAMMSLALYYAVGSDGFEENPQLSFQWYVNAANAGNTKAMSEVSSCYLIGDGVRKNLEAAISWASKGANAGSAVCVLQLAKCYGESFTPAGRAAELRCLERAIRMGDREVYEQAAASLGFFFGGAYIFNSPVDQYNDRRKAAYCFTLRWICDNNDDVKETLRKIGYHASQREFEQWCADARALRYNP